jgi:ADP-heptose:LPS heptosyltransferase
MSWLKDSIKTDCRHYIGEKPCKYRRLCPSCNYYSPMGKRILIIKLGAAGDALRTTPILRTLAKKHGRHHVTWVTDRISHGLLENNPYIDRLMLLERETWMILAAQKFDRLYSVDKALPAAALASVVRADEKLGFFLNDHGALDVFDDAGAYSLWLGINDPLKFRKNEKTYQEITFEMLGLPWNQERYVFEMTDEQKKSAKDKLAQIGAAKSPLIGLNTGAGTVFPTKKWPIEEFIELAEKLIEEIGGTVLIMGGPEEVERNAEILAALEGKALDAGCDNSLGVFAAMVAELDCLITADSLAMHLAIAAEVPTVALFGPTTPVEVTLYGKGEKIWGNPDCAPCYKAVCKESEPFACMKSILVEQVFDAVKKAIEN